MIKNILIILIALVGLYTIAQNKRVEDQLPTADGYYQHKLEILEKDDVIVLDKFNLK